ncbi:hypothetical protein GA0070614_4033 [Micromonospora coxensis]|uniref:PPE family protein n=1 Tax=Micromonospora coxensis TaxID=356852 RepID=A0A1C5J6S6_9ACTN|nr:hypothetical protein GA0070614_4033 [Micromonospora coxensis]
MWACLQDHDTSGHWKQVAGWRKVCDLAMNHMRRLHEYRRGLAEAWPPETNAAARAYLAELDQLIEKVQRTHDTAAANHDALAAATRAIDSARPQVKTLYEQYATKLAQKRSYEEMITDPKALAGNRTTKPPVTDADLEQLNSQARGIMFGLSGELQQAQVMLQKPPPRPTPGRQIENPDAYAVGPAPLIPPVIPVPLAVSTENRSVNGAGKATAPVPIQGAPSVGPVLGGANTGLAHPPASGQPGVLPGGPGSSTSTPGPASSLGLPIGQSGGNSGLRGPATRSGPGSTNQGSNSARAFPSRPVHPGGLIGGVPGLPLGQPGGGTSPRRVNPVGGVIGGGAAGTAPTGAAGSRPGGGRGQLSSMPGLHPIGGSPGMGGGGQGIGNTTGRRPARQEQVGGESRRWDPDNPWETDEGVSPVVLPPDEDGPIDPGPAIGFQK